MRSPAVLDPTSPTAHTGTVVRAQGGFYFIRTPDDQVVEASARGKLKLMRGGQRITSKTLVVVGDAVTYIIGADGRGFITAVAERHSKLARKAAFEDKEHVIIANLDQLAIVLAAAQPPPRLRGLDRFLVIAEHNQLPALIVVNKIDLLEPGVPEEVFDLYRQIGYPVIYTSVKTGQGLEELSDALVGKISAFAGPSGVGKSSLLNRIQPGLGQAVSDISEATGKGRHTTSAAELFPMAGGGYIADTAGIREIGLWEMDEGEIAVGFREFRPFTPDCKFSGCTHRHEPGCAVRAAVERGDIAPQRYDSYLRLLEEDTYKDPWER
ncbi:MAG: ribosome small subunit-dependent GTPase A [Anaerolineae bacterium]|nr:ribosome small subunit-dependent GTPase A [Anaerolineae bacterium]